MISVAADGNRTVAAASGAEDSRVESIVRMRGEPKNDNESMIQLAAFRTLEELTGRIAPKAEVAKV